MPLSSIRRAAVRRNVSTSRGVDPSLPPPLAGPNFMRVTGVTDMGATTPDSTSFDQISTGSFTAVVRVALDLWHSTTTAQRLCGMHDGTAANGVWRFSLAANGILELLTSSGGATQVTGAATVALSSSIVDGDMIWLRVTASSSLNQASFYWAPDSDTVPTTWTTISSNRGISAFPLTNPASCRMWVGTTGTSTVPSTGNYSRCIVYPGTSASGTPVVDFNAQTPAAGATSWVSATSGETWTVQNGATIAASSTTGGGVVGDPVPPSMPTTSADSTWQLTWSQGFDTAVAEGGVMASTSPYAGSASATNLNSGKFYPYTYSAYKDTRSKSKRTITVTTVAGSTTITSSGAFVTSGSTYYWDTVRPYLTGTTSTFTTPPSAGWNGTTPVRIEAVGSSSSATVSRAADISGTFSVVVQPDFGFYDEGAYSVVDGKLRLNVHTSADGRHHVGALSPKVNSDTTSGGTQQNNVLGGRFTICMRVPTPIPGYKVAFLMWPKSNVSNPDGEIDFPEQDLDGLDTATTFLHPQVVNGDTSQSSNGSSVDVVDTNWHTFVMEWRPNPTTPTASTLKTFVDGTAVMNTTGIRVPKTPMHWVWQQETNLSKSKVIDDTVQGYLEVAWSTFEKMV